MYTKLESLDSKMHNVQRRIQDCANAIGSMCVLLREVQEENTRLNKIEAAAIVVANAAHTSAELYPALDALREVLK